MRGANSREGKRAQTGASGMRSGGKNRDTHYQLLVAVLDATKQCWYLSHYMLNQESRALCAAASPFHLPHLVFAECYK